MGSIRGITIQDDLGICVEILLVTLQNATEAANQRVPLVCARILQINHKAAKTKTD